MAWDYITEVVFQDDTTPTPNQWTIKVSNLTISNTPYQGGSETNIIKLFDGTIAYAPVKWKTMATFAWAEIGKDAGLKHIRDMINTCNDGRTVSLLVDTGLTVNVPAPNTPVTETLVGFFDLSKSKIAWMFDRRNRKRSSSLTFIEKDLRSEPLKLDLF